MYDLLLLQMLSSGELKILFSYFVNVLIPDMWVFGCCLDPGHKITEDHSNTAFDQDKETTIESNFSSHAGKYCKN